MIGQLSESSIARRARVDEFRDAKVFPGLVGYHSEGSLASTEITISKKHDLKELARALVSINMFKMVFKSYKMV